MALRRGWHRQQCVRRGSSNNTHTDLQRPGMSPDNEGAAHHKDGVDGVPHVAPPVAQLASQDALIQDVNLWSGSHGEQMDRV